MSLALWMLAAPAAASPAGGEPSGWATEFRIQGVHGAVNAALEFEDDLVIAGRFTIAGPIVAPNIARWDGRDWFALGHLDGTVRALAVHEGQIYAGGQFTAIERGPGGTLARWNGSSWERVDGIENQARPTRTWIHALASTPMGLLAGGEFTHADGRSAPALALWTGESWIPWGDALDASAIVHSIVPFGSAVAIGGEFTGGGTVPLGNVAIGAGGAWEDLDGGVEGSVSCLFASGDTLYVGGRFDHRATPGVVGIGGWDGASWFALGSGVGGEDPTVYAITRYRGEIVAGGAFTVAGGDRAFRLARWNGETWRLASTGVVGSGAVFALTRFRTVLVAGGEFVQVDGHSCYGVSQYNGTAWNPLGVGHGMADAVFGLSALGDDVLASGAFRRSGRSSARFFARWDGSAWNDPGAKLNDAAFQSLPVGSSIFVVGLFTQSAAGATRFVTYYDGSTWLSPRGGGRSAVRVVGAFGSEVIVGGEFLRMGGRDASHIAAWDGALWHALAEGLDATPHAFLLEEPPASLLVGGAFLLAGNQPAPYLARWDGERWLPFEGPSPDGPVHALSRFESSLVVGGDFTHVGDVAAGAVARWDGASWSGLGTGMDGPVLTLTSHAGRLVAGGRFTTADGKLAPGLAFWDGFTWNPVDTGVHRADSTAYALLSLGDALYVGGSFHLAGATASTHIARWNGRIPVAIWPGDCNGDGTVDGRDLLPIGRFWKSTGPARQDASLTWRMEAGPDWENNAQAHADADGSGRIDASDVNALILNWRRTRYDSGPTFDPEAARAEILQAIEDWPSAVREAIREQLLPAANGELRVPNPLVPGAPILLQLENPAEASLALYDVQGRCVRLLTVRGGPAGEAARISWDGLGGDGNPLPSGIYFVRALIGDRMLTRKTLVLH